MKMEISIRCNCGSALTFEDTPVDGALKFPIACVSCGADCTPKANEFIRRKLAGPSTDTSEAKSGKSWLSGFGRKPKPETEEQTNQFANITTAPEMNPETGEEAGSKRLMTAGLAALVVGFLGAIGWFYIAKITGYEIGYVAWALGGLVGWTSRLVAPRGHQMLGVVATIAAFAAIGGGQYLTSRWVIHEAVRDYVPMAYEEIVAYAKEIEAAETSEDLRERTAEFKLVEALAGKDQTNAIAAYQTYQVAESPFALLGIIEKSGQPKLTFAERDKLTEAENVTVPDLARFDAHVIPEMKKLAEGQPSQAAYESTLAKEIHSRISMSNIAANAINMYTLLWLFLGLGSAYRIARNAGLQY